MLQQNKLPENWSPGKNDNTNWREIRESDEFQQLIVKKKKTLIPVIIFFFSFYFLLPFFTSYFSFLNKKAVGPLSWAFLYALSQFVMTWSLCIFYLKKAEVWDRMVVKILNKTERNA
ncbi:DUF485 domain-containing protein [Bacillus alveayuensis]|uniref:DUF485 domain-containing protein n=1 Tax=Aeribacillus alveayuensis TaxID=279215 RepID=UPI0005D1293E|nr:DUF485 domain-containing protein [Bacillus alveayuensis]